jgi:hypothetical protein
LDLQDGSNAADHDDGADRHADRGQSAFRWLVLATKALGRFVKRRAHKKKEKRSPLTFYFG